MSYKKGLPILALVLGAPWVLMHFNSVRYQYGSTGMLTQEEQLRVSAVAEAKKAGVAVDPRAEAVLKEAYAESTKEWINIRGPRPWEDSREYQDKVHEDLQSRKSL